MLLAFLAFLLARFYEPVEHVNAAASSESSTASWRMAPFRMEVYGLGAFVVCTHWSLQRIPDLDTSSRCSVE